MLAQLGAVLHFEFPTDVQSVLSVAQLIALDLSTLVHVDCLTSTPSPQAAFYALWWFKIAVMPLALLGAAAVYCTLAPVKSWQTASSLVLFLVCEPRARSLHGATGRARTTVA